MHDDRFFVRWSRRKMQARKPRVSDLAAQKDDLQAGRAETPPACEVLAAQQQPANATTSTSATEQSREAPPLTLADVAQLTRDSDFAPFVAQGVQSEVKNAALRKLFSDPHFNVMDGLDVYIADYNAPAPPSHAALLKMAQAKFLGLLKNEVEELAVDHPAPTQVAMPDAGPNRSDSAAVPEAASQAGIGFDENADLQLQPHDAVGRARFGPDAGKDGGGKR